MAKTVDLPPPDYAKKYEGEDGSTKRYSKFPHRTQGDNDIYLHPSVNSKPNTDVDEYGYLKSESLQRAEYLRMDGGPLSSTYDIQNTYQTNYKRRLQSAPNERMNTAESAYEQPYTIQPTNDRRSSAQSYTQQQGFTFPDGSTGQSRDSREDRTNPGYAGVYNSRIERRC